MMKRACLLFFGLFMMGVSALMAQNYDEIRRMIEAGEYDQAKAKLEAIIQDKPKSIDKAYYWKGMIDYAQEDYESASASFRMGLDERSRSVWCLTGSGLMAMKEGNVAEGEELLQKALDYNKGKNSEVELAIAEAYLAAGKAKVGEAKKILYQLKDKEPDNCKANIALADYYMEVEVPELAIEEYNKALSKCADYVPAYVSLAELYFNQGTYKEGYQMANKAIEIDPNYPPAYRIRGELYLLVKEYEKATADYQKYVSLTEGDIQAQIRYASFLFLVNKNEEAVSILNSLEQQGIESTLMQRLKGIALLKIGELDKAQASLDKYFEMAKPQFTIAADYEAYGDIMRLKGDIEKADNYYEKAIEKNISRVAKYTELADAYQDSAKAAEEVEKKFEFYGLQAHYLEKMIQNKDAEDLKDFYALGKAQYYSKQFEASNASFDKVIELKDDWVTAYVWKLRIGDQLDKADTTKLNWFTVEPAEDIVRLVGETTPEELSKAEKSALISALTVLAFYSFDPEGTKEYDCDAAQPYIDKLQVIDPDNRTVDPLEEYCAQISQQQGGR